MATLKRVRMTFSGTGVVGESVSTLYFRGEDTGVASALRSWVAAFATNIPESMTVILPSSGDLIDSETGEITGTWTETPVSSVTGINSQSFALGVGASMVWDTTARTNGRPTRGRTFLVPLSSNAFTTTGRVHGDFKGRATGSEAAALVGQSACALQVWTRPRGTTPGGTTTVTGFHIPDEPAFLSSRKH